MNLCILDQNNVCVRVIVADSENPAFLSDGEKYAPDHTGAIGITWDDVENKWDYPKPPEPTPVPEDVAAANIRRKRDRLLQETDWIVIKSYERGENIPATWELYRQALRDITAQAGFPYSVEWPTKPE
jgi:hypothetical protein